MVEYKILFLNFVGNRSPIDNNLATTTTDDGLHGLSNKFNTNIIKETR